MSSRLSICIFIDSTPTVHLLTKLLSGQEYQLHIIKTATELSKFAFDNKEELDCLILSDHQESLDLIRQFEVEGLILPAVILSQQQNLIHSKDLESASNTQTNLDIIQNNKTIELSPPSEIYYHSAEILISINQLENIQQFIRQSISQYLSLAPSCSLSENQTFYSNNVQKIKAKQQFLLLQQKRLADKFKERFGYFGIYYKRNANYFHRNMIVTEQEELITQLSLEYKEIILNYFNEESKVNEQIDNFVNQVFFADISVSQILEIHMELMDEFAQQLKLEGRSEDILIDYRLALIDIISHLCEMYRRSIPQEDISVD